MSQPVVEKFFKAVVEDQGLQAACTEAFRKADLEAIVRIAAERGHSFTVGDLKKAWEAQVAQLSEADLAQAAGGVGQDPMASRVGAVNLCRTSTALPCPCCWTPPEIGAHK